MDLRLLAVIWLITTIAVLFIAAQIGESGELDPTTELDMYQVRVFQLANGTLSDSVFTVEPGDTLHLMWEPPTETAPIPEQQEPVVIPGGVWFTTFSFKNSPALYSTTGDSATFTKFLELPAGDFYMQMRCYKLFNGTPSKWSDAAAFRVQVPNLPPQRIGWIILVIKKGGSQ